MNGHIAIATGTLLPQKCSGGGPNSEVENQCPVEQDWSKTSFSGEDEKSMVPILLRDGI
jgi:hypothetical protein